MPFNLHAGPGELAECEDENATKMNASLWIADQFYDVASIPLFISLHPMYVLYLLIQNERHIYQASIYYFGISCNCSRFSDLFELRQ